MKSLSLLACTFAASQLFAADWPQWRGPSRNDENKETGLLKQWPEGGPKQLWVFKDAGMGYSGPAIVDGKLYTMGTRDGHEILLALDANTGKELWNAKLGDVLKNGWGDGPRGTPTVDGGRIYTLGGDGTLVCLEAKDGKEVWRRTMKEIGGEIPGWGYTESVLVDGEQVVCTPGGGKGAMAAFDKKDGKSLWQSKDFTDGAQYSSIVKATINGEPQYIQLTQQHVIGISPKDGAVLWKQDFPGKVAVIPTPVVKDNQVYVTAGYGVGCMALRIEPGNKVSQVYDNKVMKNHHGGVDLIGDYIYGHSDGAGWMCQKFLTGEQVWNEKSKLGKGALGHADGMLYCLGEDGGDVVLVEASPTGWNEHGRFKLDPQTAIRNPQGRIWTHPVIANGKLYLRDQDLIHCYAVK